MPWDGSEDRRSSAVRAGIRWKKIGGIGGGTFVGLMLIGALAGDPEENEVMSNELATQEVTTTTDAPTTTEARTTTTETPTTTAAPPTTTTAAPPPPPTTAAPVTAPPPPPDPYAAETASQRNARRSAEDYLDYTAFSRSGLIDQLEFEGFSPAEAE